MCFLFYQLCMGVLLYSAIVQWSQEAPCIGIFDQMIKEIFVIYICYSPVRSPVSLRICMLPVQINYPRKCLSLGDMLKSLSTSPQAFDLAVFTFCFLFGLFYIIIVSLLFCVLFYQFVTFEVPILGSLFSLLFFFWSNRCILALFFHFSIAIVFKLLLVRRPLFFPHFLFP